MDGYDKVFGIGLNKTGTTSLRVALKAMGFRHLDRMPALMKHWRRGEIGPILDVAERFESFDDWPWPLIVPDLLDRFGARARFVLTRRSSPATWLDSLKAHSERTNPFNHPRRAIYGHDYPHGYEAEHLAVYDRHLTSVRHLFGSRGMAHLLLEVSWEDGHGWAELAAFLNRQAPAGPFPHANDRAASRPDPENLADNAFLIEAQLSRLRAISRTRRLA